MIRIQKDRDRGEEKGSVYPQQFFFHHLGMLLSVMIYFLSCCNCSNGQVSEYQNFMHNSTMYIPVKEENSSVE